MTSAGHRRRDVGAEQSRADRCERQRQHRRSALGAPRRPRKRHAARVNSAHAQLSRPAQRHQCLAALLLASEHLLRERDATIATQGDALLNMQAQLTTRAAEIEPLKLRSLSCSACSSAVSPRSWITKSNTSNCSSKICRPTTPKRSGKCRRRERRRASGRRANHCPPATRPNSALATG